MTNASLAFLLVAQSEPATTSNIDIWAPVVAALIASALTGTISWMLMRQQQSHDRAAEHLRFMRSKLEETHEVGRSILLAFNALHTRVSAMIATQADSQTMELMNNFKTATISEGGTPKLRMLVEFYCPELLSKLELIEHAIMKYGAVVTQAIRTMSEGNRLSRDLLNQEIAAHDAIREAINDFHSALSGVARGPTAKRLSGTTAVSPPAADRG